MKCLYNRAYCLMTKPIISEEKKQLSTVLLSHGYPSSFVTKHLGHTWWDLRTPLLRLNKIAWFTGFLVSAAVYIRETGRSMQEGIKENDRDIRFARTQTSVVSEHTHETGYVWDEVKFIDRDSHWYTRRVKGAIHIRLHPYNINKDSGIEIPEAWMPTVKKHNRYNIGTMRIEMHQSQPIIVI